MVPIEHCDSLAVASESLRAEAARFLSALASTFAAQGKGMLVFERVLHAARQGQRPAHTHYQVVGLPADAAARAKDTFVTEGAFRYVPLLEMGTAETLEGAVRMNGAPSSSSASAAVEASGAAAVEGSSSSPVSAGPSTCEYFYAEVPSAGSAVPAGTTDAQPLTGGADAEAAAAGGMVETGAEAGAAAAAGTTTAPRPAFTRLLHRVPMNSKHPVQFGREVVCRLLNLPDRLAWKSCVDPPEVEARMTEAFRASFAPFDFTAEL